jgi:hypothetical protein
MATPGPGTFTQLALSIQADNQQFQAELTNVYTQAARDPELALQNLDRCWARADQLEQRELDFLGKMGDFGMQQTQGAKENWRQIRLLILTGKAQVLFKLARYDECQATIDSGKAYLSGPEDANGSTFDQLEVGILQMRG